MRLLHVSILLLLLRGVPGAVAADPPTTQRGPLASWGFPTFGVAVELPPQWRTLTHCPINQVNKWVLAGDDLRTVRAALTIDVEPVNQRTLAKYAAGFAQTTGGTVAADRLTVAGQPALRINYKPPAKPDVLHPVQVLITENRDLFHVLARWETAGTSAADDFKTMVETLRFRDRQPPLKQAAFRKAAFPVFNLLFMNSPAVARSVPVKDATTQFHQSIINYTTGRPEFFVNVDLVTTDGSRTLAQVAEDFGKKTATQLGLKTPVVLKARDGRPARMVSDPIEARPPGAPPEAKASLQWALLQVDAKRLVMVMFTIAADKPETVAGYQAIADKILESITPAAAEKRPATAP